MQVALNQNCCSQAQKLAVYMTASSTAIPQAYYVLSLRHCCNLLMVVILITSTNIASGFNSWVV
jgi:hypothetical protein